MLDRVFLPYYSAVIGCSPPQYLHSFCIVSPSMTKVSRIPLDEKDLQDLTADFWRALARLRTPKEIEHLLAGFFTHTEIKMFAKRLRIASMLLRHKPYNEICRTLKVTDAPVARLNNLLNENKQFREIIKKL